MKVRFRALLPIVVAACASQPSTPAARPPASPTPRAAAEPQASTKSAPYWRTSRVGASNRTASRARVPANVDAIAGRILAQTNVARRRVGARPLRHDARLARAAHRYARELARRQEIEHVSRTPGRRTFRERIAREGGRARIAGENLARLTASEGTLPVRVVHAWMKSPGHKSNMLDRVYARSGVGVWMGSDGVWYVVQVYATAS